MPITDTLFTTYGPIFFKATTYRGLNLVNEERAKQGLDPIEDVALVAPWKQRAKIADTLERKGNIYTDPITELLK
jgi:phosphopantetheine adenylyltransferase